MRGVYKIHGAAQTAQARHDYLKLCALAREVKCSTLVPSVRANAGWRTIDVAAQVAVERLLREHPELRDKVRDIYPGFVEDLCISPNG